MNYYVYWVHLKNHDKNTEGYIGITNNPKARWADHKYHAKKGTHRNNYFQNAINKYGNRLIHEILFEGSLDQCAAYENNLRPKEKIGWNCNIGGECPGMAGRKHTEKTKKVLSDIAIKHNFVSVMHNKESWSKISKSMSGSKNHQAKSIICNETQKVFNTVTEASKWLGCSSQAISKHLRGKQKSVKNYTFKYYKE